MNKNSTHFLVPKFKFAKKLEKASLKKIFLRKSYYLNNIIEIQDAKKNMSNKTGSLPDSTLWPKKPKESMNARTAHRCIKKQKAVESC